MEPLELEPEEEDRDLGMKKLPGDEKSSHSRKNCDKTPEYLLGGKDRCSARGGTGMRGPQIISDSIQAVQRSLSIEPFDTAGFVFRVGRELHADVWATPSSLAAV
ncbi:MAG TPA: hypothetical protein VIT18_08305, partial [Terrimicrobiaceae bacterium]